ncbi:MAG: [Fe-Fe] hydrogenase large subunit C-terminal domain-containing protein [Ignavibacteriales bacterium]
MAVISTIEARCKDCYKCLRSCPVKAIRFVGGASKSDLHAKVMAERCILDGTCLLACPQRAKKVRLEKDAVKALLESGRTVIASLAPSFAGALLRERQGRVVSAIKRLGFERVEETAYAAGSVSSEHVKALDGMEPPVITSSCPVVVNLVEMYYPEVMAHLAPVVSPMVAHARYLKAAIPGAAVVFIGPCVAKKDEAERSGDVDAVLTFAELSEWLREEGIDLESLEECAPDGPGPVAARLFPIDGGLLRTATLSTDVLSEEYRVISGVENCMQFFDRLRADHAEGNRLRLVEMLACTGGCIAGPGVQGCVPVVEASDRRQTVIEYYRAHAGDERPAPAPVRIDLSRCYKERSPGLAAPDEVTIRGILAQTGKLTPEDELNCGACGYGSCREKAVAVFHGFADLQMCMPFMRERAESLSNVVLGSTPNGVVVVDHRLNVIDMNRAAETMFGCARQKMTGKPLVELIDPENFERVLESKKMLRVRVDYPQYSISTEQSVFYVEKENVVIGIFVDRTEEQKRKSEALRTRQSVISRAQEVIDKQMKVAQEIAGLLGETTAETKILLTKLMELMKRDE